MCCQRSLTQQSYYTGLLPSKTIIVLCPGHFKSLSVLCIFSYSHYLSLPATGCCQFEPPLQLGSLWLQAFALASHACQVHIGTQPGLEHGDLALPLLKSAQPPALPSHSSIPLPQVEVSSAARFQYRFRSFHCLVIVQGLSETYARPELKS